MDKPYKLNVAGLSKQKIGIDQPDIADLLVNDFSNTLHKRRDLYLTRIIFSNTLHESNEQVKIMQNYKTSQVGGRASQVGGIACIFKVNKRSLEPSGMAVIRPKWR